jgi:hypothetical protein
LRSECVPVIPPAAPAILGTCPYYQYRHDNFEERHQACSHVTPDYYLNYGLKYCLRFGNELMPKLTPKGKAWLTKCRYLLQLYLEKGLAKDPNCELLPSTLKKVAFDSHPPAYLDAGLYAIPTADKIRVGFTPDAKEWTDWSTWQQAGAVAWKHLENYSLWFAQEFSVVDPGIDLSELGETTWSEHWDAVKSLATEIPSDLKDVIWDAIKEKPAY